MLSPYVRNTAKAHGDELADIAENGAYRHGLTPIERAEYVRVVVERMNDHANRLQRESE
jgi:hypothetical protein